MTEFDPRDRNHDGRVSAAEKLEAYLASRRGPVKIADHLPHGRWNVNAWLATWITRVVGTMWCFYVFNGIALVSLPTAIRTGDPTIIVNWISSNWMQLILLPALMVGQVLQGKAADARTEQMYQDAEATLQGVARIEQALARIGGGQ